MADLNFKRALYALLPTRSGFALLATLGLIIWGLAHWIFWVLDHVPEGSDTHTPTIEQSAPKRVVQDTPQ